jgi:hypothetical protein
MAQKRGRGGRSEVESRGASGQLFGIGVRGYTIGSWCPTPDGSGPPSAVMMQLHLDVPDFPALCLRLKTPEAVQDMIDALREHQKDVWPNYNEE